MTDKIISSPLLEEVRQVLSNLIDNQLLTVISSSHDVKLIGGSTVVLAGRNVKVRLVDVLGESRADASARDEEAWVPLETMLRAVGVQNAPEPRLISVTETEELLASHLTELESGLSSERLHETRRRLDMFETEAVKREMEYARATRSRRSE